MDRQSSDQEHQLTIRRPKLLFLALYFPPLNAIACVRTWNIAKYLARLGWDVTVVTAKSSLWRNVENADKVVADLEREGVRRIATGHRWRWLSPLHLICWNSGLGWIAGGICRRVARYLEIDEDIGWLRPAEEACSTLTRDDVDVILATGGPFAAFRLAKRLSDRLTRPYVLDYRDPWTENPHADLPTLPGMTTIRKEAELISGCAAVTTVSRSWGSTMAQRFKLGRKLHVLTNGYDPDELVDVKPCNFGHLAMVYAGTLYPPKRVVTPVMAALKRLKDTMCEESGMWYFHYYGEWEEYVREEAGRFDVMDRVILHGRVSRAEVLSAIRGATITVVITSVLTDDSQQDRGIVTGKLFEPLGLGTPILLIAPAGSDASEVVEETGQGQSFVGTDVEGIIRFLSSVARQTCTSRGPTCADNYSWPLLSAKLDRILRAVIAGNHRTIGPQVVPVSKIEEAKFSV